MKYYTLGNTGLKVSRLALGTMTFGEDWSWRANEKSARQIFDTYLEAGGGGGGFFRHGRFIYQWT